MSCEFVMLVVNIHVIVLSCLTCNVIDVVTMVMMTYRLRLLIVNYVSTGDLKIRVNCVFLLC